MSSEQQEKFSAAFATFHNEVADIVTNAAPGVITPAQVLQISVFSF